MCLTMDDMILHGLELASKHFLLEKHRMSDLQEATFFFPNKETESRREVAGPGLRPAAC